MSENPAAPARAALYRVAMVLIVGIGAARIVSTYREFTQTVDEPCHLACGMQLLQDRVYNIDLQHPPLTRMLIALGPYLNGLRLSGHGDWTELGNRILNSNQNYWNNLALARLGTLPFFVLACAVVWLWSNHLFGRRAALFALLFFTLLPPVLAHGSLATTDMGAAATLSLALYCFTLWLEKPGWPTALRLGVALGLAIVSKFSSLLFLPGCAAALLILILVTDPSHFRKWTISRAAGNVAAAVLVAFVVIWAGYLFRLEALTGPPPHPAIDRLFASHASVHHAMNVLLETRYPGVQLPKGIAALASHNSGGHTAFLLGEWRRKGWWYFFPVLLLVKTPLPFILLCGIGIAFLARPFLTRLFKDQRDWRMLAPMVFAGMIVALSTTSNINGGVRHVLAVYPLLAIVTGYAASVLWDSLDRPVVSRLLLAAALIGLASSSVLAHPNYLAYFNLLASSEPERIEVDSDLDWGQDLARLSKWLRAREIQDVNLSYFGSADLDHADLPRVRELIPYQKASGWIAISAYNLALPTCARGDPSPGRSTYYYIPGSIDRIASGDGPFSWLSAYKPVEKIGSSIFVYRVSGT